MSLRRTKSAHAAMRERLAAHVAIGGSLKEFCFNEGIQIAWVYRMLQSLGVRFCYLTADEQRLIAEHRSKRRAAA